jgi:hypothetical protein
MFTYIPTKYSVDGNVDKIVNWKDKYNLLVSDVASINNAANDVQEFVDQALADIRALYESGGDIPLTINKNRKRLNAQFFNLNLLKGL